MAAPTGGFPLPVVTLPHLVALKLSTGAFRDEVDVGDLLEPALGRVLARIGRR